MTISDREPPKLGSSGFDRSGVTTSEIFFFFLLTKQFLFKTIYAKEF
jgi:hypothetical protein